MKYIFLFLFSMLLSFFAVFLFDRLSHRQTIQNAKQSVQISKEKIPFSIEKAPSESLKGEIISMTGKVFWESRTATESSLLKNSIELQQGESIETGEDGNVEVSIAKMCTIDIGANASILFVQTLPQNIVLNQSKGVATYTKITEKPLSVRSLHLLTVQGSGTMTVSVDEGFVSVSVKQGAASMAFNDLDNNVAKISVTKGQEYLFNDETRVGEILE